MEYQGIITGIGDKDTNKNLIKPEYDAVINDFVIGKNTILEGLVLNGKNLSAGTCILCGYRGIIEKNKTLDTTDYYVYGKFTLGSIYGGSGEDDFDIITSTTVLTENVNPTEITSAGTYYLLLYKDGVERIDRVHNYPLKAEYSVETENVVGNAKIDSEVEGVTQLPNDNSNRIATTQYVHNQIEEEIDYGEFEGNVYNNRGELLFSYKLRRKSKYVIGEIVSNSSSLSLGIGQYDKIPSGYLPNGKIYFGCVLYAQLGENCMLSISTDGAIAVESFETSASSINTSIFGYQCQ